MNSIKVLSENVLTCLYISSCMYKREKIQKKQCEGTSTPTICSLSSTWLIVHTHKRFLVISIFFWCWLLRRFLFLKITWYLFHSFLFCLKQDLVTILKLINTYHTIQLRVFIVKNILQFSIKMWKCKIVPAAKHF